MNEIKLKSKNNIPTMKVFLRFWLKFDKEFRSRNTIKSTERSIRTVLFSFAISVPAPPIFVAT